MDWNNNTLYKNFPSRWFTRAFANIIQQNPNRLDTVYDFRNFI
jgi:hypothetical protein